LWPQPFALLASFAAANDCNYQNPDTNQCIGPVWVCAEPVLGTCASMWYLRVIPEYVYDVAEGSNTTWAYQQCRDKYKCDYDELADQCYPGPWLISEDQWVESWIGNCPGQQ